jgi:hypothetical protein
MSSPEPARIPVIVTGANQPFWRSLWQFLKSAERRGVHQTFRWLVYDLGLSLQSRERIKRDFPWATMRGFDFSAYPPHVAMERRSFAWKPIIVADVLDESDSPVFWFDSATIVTSDLQGPLDIVSKLGIFSLKGDAPLEENTDPRTLAALNVPRELYHLPERVGGAVGFHPDFVIARTIARAWARHALIEDHIMPPNEKPGHNVDQSVLAALLCLAQSQGLLTLNEDEVDICSGRPNRWITTRNKVSPNVPIWADPIIRLYYYIWKAVDQFLYRFKDWEKRAIGAAERRYREHFEVSVQCAGRAPVAIQSPSGSYYADPFPLRHDGKNYVLVEDYTYHAAKGRLLCLSLDDELNVKAADPILPMPWHASFPFVLQHGDKTYMVPETHEGLCIDLYIQGATPLMWSLKRRLIYGINAADTVVLSRAGLWWLITSVQEDGKPNRHLEIYYANDLLSGEFKPHPVNAERRYQDATHGTGRNAGTYLQTPQGLVRPMQSSSKHYGQGMQLMLITKLDTKSFEETPCTLHTVYSDVVDVLSPHHIAQNGELLAWDVRDRAR